MEYNKRQKWWLMNIDNTKFSDLSLDIYCRHLFPLGKLLKGRLTFTLRSCKCVGISNALKISPFSQDKAEIFPLFLLGLIELLNTPQHGGQIVLSNKFEWSAVAKWIKREVAWAPKRKTWLRKNYNRPRIHFDFLYEFRSNPEISKNEFRYTTLPMQLFSKL